MPKSLRLIACLLAASPLVACGNDDATRAASANPAAPVAAAPVVTPTQANVDIVEKHLAAFNAHDRDGAGALLHDDVFYFDATYGDGQNGRDAAVDNTIGVMLDAMPDLEWQLRSDPVAAGDSVAYEWTLTGTHAGMWLGIPASHQKVQIKGMSVVRIKDGLIIYKADYYDAATLNEQLGL